MTGETVRGMTTRQVRPIPGPQARINTDAAGASAFDLYPEGDSPGGEGDGKEGASSFSLHRLMDFANTAGNICDKLPDGLVSAIGVSAIQEWLDDRSTHQPWRQQAASALNAAAQHDPDRPTSGTGKNSPWEDASNVRYPIIAKATLDWHARAYPELVRGDTLVRAKVFVPRPDDGVSPMEAAKDAGQPPNPQAAAALGQAVQAGEQNETGQADQKRMRQARADRIAKFINHVFFYQMPGWEEDTDLMFAQMPPAGQGFKKIYMGPDGVRSDFVSALDLVVDNDRTKDLHRCPRISHEFERYPYEIADMVNAERWNRVDLPVVGPDPEAPRTLLEQMRMEDLDGDGVSEPYLVTLDVETRQVLCIEAAYRMEDVTIDESVTPPRVTKFDRWRCYASFKFLVDPRAKFYGMGFGRLLDSITDAVDTSINQMMDANFAVIAGGGFIGAGVKLAGGGQGGQLYFQPGQYQTVSVPGQDIRAAIYEKTTPNLSPETYKLLELLLAAAKDLASVKDVLSGEGPANAPVGTTLALQQQAMQTFSAIFKRVYRGFREEASMVYECLRRWKRPQDQQLYQELTGGDWEEDFEGDDQDVELVADPNVISTLMKVSRVNALTQMAESAVGQAAGMLQKGPAQELVREGLDAMDVDRPERFLADAPPNPETLAKVQLTQAQAEASAARAELDKVKAGDTEAQTTERQAGTLHQLALSAKESHGLYQEADRIVADGTIREAEEPEDGQAQGPSAEPGGPGAGAGPGPGPGAPGQA